MTVTSRTLFGREVKLDDAFATDEDLEAIDSLLPSVEHGWIQSNPNNAGERRWIHYRKYVPAKVKCVLVYQHGIQGHSSIAHKLENGRVTNFALTSRECLKRGIALYTPDMAGHGLSEGVRFFIPNADWTVNRDDLDLFARFAASQHENVPLFLGGESYGANLAINLSGKWQQMKQEEQEEKGNAKASDGTEGDEAPPSEFAGFVVNAPAIIGDLPPFPITFALRNILAPLYPEWTPFFMPHPVNPESIWSDDEVRAKQTSEHSKRMNLGGCGKPFRLGTAAAMVSALEHAREVTIPSLLVPYFVSHGTKDSSVPISGTEYLLEHSKTPIEDRCVNKAEGSFHDLLSEPTAEQSIEVSLDWIIARSEEGKWRLKDM